MPTRWSATSISATDRTEFSAGGVVLRGDRIAVIVPVKRDAAGRRVLGLPKGHPEPGETPEQAATREVREETGLQVELVEALGEVTYSYERNGVEIAKRVAFFLFEFRGGDLSDHDHEIEEARWMAPEEALAHLSYEGEREMVRRVLSRRASDR